MTTVLNPTYAEPILVVADIIQTWMDLNPGQVMLAYQKFNIPTNGLFIVLTNVSDQDIAGDNYLQPDGQGGQEEVGQDYEISDIQIDIMSFDDEARQRRREVMMALRSIYSQQQQVQNFLQIAPNIMPMVDSSALEITKYLNRFTARIRVTSVDEVIRSNAPYYSGITAQLNTDPVGTTPVEINPADTPA